MQQPKKKKIQKNEKLRRARLDRNWTQSRLAELLGSSADTVRSWEGGYREPSKYAKERLCELFGMTSHELGLNEYGLSELVETVILDEAPIHVEKDGYARSKVDGGDETDTKVQHFVRSGMNESRQRMLTRVYERWIKGVFEESLYHHMLLILQLREQPDLIEDPWREEVREFSALPQRDFPLGTRIAQIYDQADGELLILGNPGSGKTTLLLELARDLIGRARESPTHPLPVFFNLSSWAEKHPPLEDWVVEEIHRKYSISTKLARKWVEQEQIVLLLDGLDDVAVEHRTACCAAINAYRNQYGLACVVVCSRYDDYVAQAGRLALNKAVVINALTDEQVGSFVAKGGKELAALGLVLQHDETLREMASSPLMLNTLAVAYQGGQVGSTPNDGDGSPDEQRNLVFARYVDRLIEKRGGNVVKDRVKRYLGWLARYLQIRSQTEFYLERLQPDGLEANGEQHLYERTVRRLVIGMLCLVCGGLAAWMKGGLKNGVVGSGNGILGFFGGGEGNTMLGWMAPGIGGGSQGGASLIIIFGIVVWLVSLLVGSPTLPDLTPRAIWYGLTSGLRTGLKFGLVISPISILVFALLGGFWHGISYGLGISFFIAMLIGLMRGLGAGLRYPELEQPRKISLGEQLVDGLVFGAGGGLSFAIVELLLQVNRTSTVIYTFVAGTFFFLAFGLGGGSRLFSSLERPIQPVEIVRWSWRHMAQDMASNVKKSLLVALVTIVSVGAIIAGTSSLFFFDLEYGLHYGLVFGTITGLIVGIAGILTSMLKSGWSSDILAKDQRIIPNEGIARSGRNALIGACVFALLGGIASGLATGAGFGLLGELPMWPVMAKAFALLVGIVFFVVFFFGHGGIAWIQHYVLRWYLHRARYMPWYYVRCLDDAAGYGLLRKVGGGYMFTHRLVLDYFAQFVKADRH